jgi:hypothetical protein
VPYRRGVAAPVKKGAGAPFVGFAQKRILTQITPKADSRDAHFGPTLRHCGFMRDDLVWFVVINVIQKTPDY